MHFTGLLLRAILSAQTDVLHHQWTRISFSTGSRFHNGGRQLPLAEITRVSDDFKRLGVRRCENCGQQDRQKEYSHWWLPLPFAARQSELLQICASIGDLGSAIVSPIGNRDDFFVIILGLGLISGLFC